MMLMLMAECIDIKRWRVIMFEWIERVIREKIIKEIETASSIQKMTMSVALTGVWQ
jgi:hypothetical protein